MSNFTFPEVATVVKSRLKRAARRFYDAAGAHGIVGPDPKAVERMVAGYVATAIADVLEALALLDPPPGYSLIDHGDHWGWMHDGRELGIAKKRQPVVYACWAHAAIRKPSVQQEKP